MKKLVKIGCLLLSFLTLSSCGHSEGEDCPAVASSIHNDVLFDVLDSNGNSLASDEDYIINNLAFAETGGDKIPFSIVDAGENKQISLRFPLPKESAMKYTADKTSGYGESTLVVKVSGAKYKLKGLFHYTCTHPHFAEFGCNGIKLVEIKSNYSNVSVSEAGDSLKVTVCDMPK